MFLLTSFFCLFMNRSLLCVVALDEPHGEGLPLSKKQKSTNKKIKQLLKSKEEKLVESFLKTQLTKEDEKFRDEYLNKYYPKVFVVREHFFSKMTFQEVAESLQRVVDIFTNKPWFYIKNNQKDCNVGMHWEYILDQLSFFSEYIERSSVNLNSKEVVFFEGSSFGNFGYFPVFLETKKRDGNYKPLKEVWQEKGIQIHHHFYALCSDYVRKMFNEGLKMKDWSKGNWYYYELRKVFDKLIGTTYEQEYHDHLKTAKDLYDRLKGKLNFNKQNNFSNSNSNDSKMWEELLDYLDD